MHYADKRIGAGKALIEGNQAALGVATLTKGEKYLERAMVQVQKTKEKGRDISPLVEKMQKACLGHQQILTDLREKTNGEGKAVLDELLGFLEILQDKAKEL